MLIAIRFSILMFVLCGLIYPLGITAVGQLLFPWQANGSLIQAANGKALGSELIGQAFSQPQYFHPRPSVNKYDAANSGGSNLGATSKKLVERITDDAKQYNEENAFLDEIALDAVATSSSGLDPDISLDNAIRQAARIAKARNITSYAVQKSIIDSAKKHCGLLDKLSMDCKRVNVLELNMALDRDLEK